MSRTTILRCDICNNSVEETGYAGSELDRWGLLNIGRRETSGTLYDLCPACIAKLRGWKP